MSQIYIIDKVHLAKDGVLTTKSNQKAHLRQGELDGACGVYSMMMCLVMEKIIKRNIIINPPQNLRRNTSDGRLVSFFLEKKGMIIDGYYLDKLEADLKSAFNKKVSTTYYDGPNLIDEILDQLDNNHPVEIQFDRIRKYGHFVVVIGYQKENSYVDLFCLDPGYPMNELQIWNNVLRIDTTSSAKYNCYNMLEKEKVSITAFLAFNKK